MKLQDKVCIVTGAASGIGPATVRLFAGEGAVVVLTALRTARISPAGKDHAR